MGSLAVDGPHFHLVGLVLAGAHSARQASNGYLDPTFLPFWGRKDREGKPDSDLKKQLFKLDRYCDMREWDELGLEGLALARDPQTRAVFTEFGKLADRFHELMAKPKFVPPDDQPLDANTLVPNFLAFRALTQYLYR